MEMTIMFVGLDVHKESLSVADGGPILLRR